MHFSSCWNCKDYYDTTLAVLKLVANWVNTHTDLPSHMVNNLIRYRLRIIESRTWILQRKRREAVYRGEAT